MKNRGYGKTMFKKDEKGMVHADSGRKCMNMNENKPGGNKKRMSVERTVYIDNSNDTPNDRTYEQEGNNDIMMHRNTPKPEYIKWKNKSLHYSKSNPYDFKMKQANSFSNKNYPHYRKDGRYASNSFQNVRRVFYSDDKKAEFTTSVNMKNNGTTNVNGNSNANGTMNSNLNRIEENENNGSPQVYDEEHKSVHESSRIEERERIVEEVVKETEIENKKNINSSDVRSFQQEKGENHNKENSQGVAIGNVQNHMIVMHNTNMNKQGRVNTNINQMMNPRTMNAAHFPVGNFMQEEIKTNNGYHNKNDMKNKHTHQNISNTRNMYMHMNRNNENFKNYHPNKKNSFKKSDSWNQESVENLNNGNMYNRHNFSNPKMSKNPTMNIHLSNNDTHYQKMNTQRESVNETNKYNENFEEKNEEPVVQHDGSYGNSHVDGYPKHIETMHINKPNFPNGLKRQKNQNNLKQNNQNKKNSMIKQNSQNDEKKNPRKQNREHFPNRNNVIESKEEIQSAIPLNISNNDTVNSHGNTNKKEKQKGEPTNKKNRNHFNAYRKKKNSNSFSNKELNEKNNNCLHGSMEEQFQQGMNNVSNEINNVIDVNEDQGKMNTSTTLSRKTYPNNMIKANENIGMNNTNMNPNFNNNINNNNNNNSNNKSHSRNYKNKNKNKNRNSQRWSKINEKDQALVADEQAHNVRKNSECSGEKEMQNEKHDNKNNNMLVETEHTNKYINDESKLVETTVQNVTEKEKTQINEKDKKKCEDIRKEIENISIKSAELEAWMRERYNHILEEYKHQEYRKQKYNEHFDDQIVMYETEMEPNQQIPRKEIEKTKQNTDSVKREMSNIKEECENKEKQNKENIEKEEEEAHVYNQEEEMQQIENNDTIFQTNEKCEETENANMNNEELQKQENQFSSPQTSYSTKDERKNKHKKNIHKNKKENENANNNNNQNPIQNANQENNGTNLPIIGILTKKNKSPRKLHSHNYSSKKHSSSNKVHNVSKGSEGKSVNQNSGMFCDKTNINENNLNEEDTNNNNNNKQNVPTLSMVKSHENNRVDMVGNKEKKQGINIGNNRKEFNKNYKQVKVTNEYVRYDPNINMLVGMYRNHRYIAEEGKPSGPLMIAPTSSHMYEQTRIQNNGPYMDQIYQSTNYSECFYNQNMRNYGDTNFNPVNNLGNARQLNRGYYTNANNNINVNNNMIYNNNNNNKYNQRNNKNFKNYYKNYNRAYNNNSTAVTATATNNYNNMNNNISTSNTTNNYNQMSAYTNTLNDVTDNSMLTNCINNPVENSMNNSMSSLMNNNPMNNQMIVPLSMNSSITNSSVLPTMTPLNNMNPYTNMIPMNNISGMPTNYSNDPYPSMTTPSMINETFYHQQQNRMMTGLNIMPEVPENVALVYANNMSSQMEPQQMNSQNHHHHHHHSNNNNNNNNNNVNCMEDTETKYNI